MVLILILIVLYIKNYRLKNKLEKLQTPVYFKDIVPGQDSDTLIAMKELINKELENRLIK